MQITAIRGAGSTFGVPVVDPLLTTVVVALSRAEAELGKSAHALQVVDITAVYRDGLKLGTLLEVQDSSQTVSWAGKLVGIQHSTTGSGKTSSLKVERLHA